MKKLISSILVALIIMSAMAVPAYAAEVDTVTHNEAIELACNVFPEYEAKIRGDHPIKKDFSRNADNKYFENIVVCETRITGDGEIFTYQEDTRGSVIVTFTHNSTIVASASGSGYAYRKCNVVVYCSLSDEVLQVEGFEYSHAQGQYDSIISYGNTNSSTANVRLVVGNTQETATMRAFVRYYASFTANKQGVSGEIKAYLQAEVGNDSCVYNVDIE